MTNIEGMPDLGHDRWLEDDELKRYAEYVIWPAVNCAYGDNFRLVADVDEWYDDLKKLENPNFEIKMKIELKMGRIDNGDDTSYYIAQFSFMNLCEGLTNNLAKRGEESSMWAVKTYSFRDDAPPECYTQLELFDIYDELVDEEEMSGYEAALINSQEPEEEFENLSKTDCLEIYNGLLELGVPEYEMRYRDWEHSVG